MRIARPCLARLARRPAAALNRGGRERGSVAVVLAVLMPLLVALVLLLWHTSKLADLKRELQAAADGMALAAAAALREAGMSTGLAASVQQAALGAYTLNASLPASDINASYNVFHDSERSTAILQVQLTASYVSPFNPFSRDPQEIRSESFARISETSHGYRWPVVVVLLDASGSMSERVEKGSSETLFSLLSRVVEAYAADPLPVRNGLVVFNSKVRASVAPPTADTSNAAAFQQALQGVNPWHNTNIRAAFKEAATLLAPFTEHERSAILITDGRPTTTGNLLQDLFGWLPGIDNPSQAAKREAEAVRKLSPDGASVFTVETRPADRGMTEFLVEVSGGPMSSGNDQAFYQSVSELGDVQQFIAIMARRVCGFGPLTFPRLRGPSNPDLIGPPQRIFAFLRLADGSETSVPLVDDATAQVSQSGFEYLSTGSGPYVILTLNTCQSLATNQGSAVIVRYGNAELIGRPTVLLPYGGGP